MNLLYKETNLDFWIMVLAFVLAFFVPKVKMRTNKDCRGSQGG